MSQKKFKKSAIALAIAGAMASGGAYAAAITLTPDAANSYVAPVSVANLPAGTSTADIKITAGYNKTVKFGLISTAALTAVAYKLYAFYYDAGDNYLFLASASNPMTANTTNKISMSLTGNTAAKKVRFVIVAATDTFTGSDSIYLKSAKGSINASADATQQNVVWAHDITATTSATGITPSEEAAVAAELKTKALAIDLVTYKGPTITLGQMSNTANTDFIGLTFDYPMTAVTAGTSLTSDIDVLKGDGTAIVGTPTSAVNMTIGKSYLKVANGNSALAFTGTAATVKTKNASGHLKDLAGNSVEFPKTVSLVEFAKPALKSVTAPVVLSGIAGPGSVANLYGSGDTHALTVKVLMNEPINWTNLATGTNTSAVANKTTILAMANGTALTGTAAAGSGSVATVTITGDTTKKFTIDPATGDVKYDGKPVTIVFKADSTASNNIKTSNGNKSLTADITSGTVKAGVKENAVIATRDDDVNGLIDGVTVDYKQPVGTPAVADYTLKTNFGGTARDITFTAAKVSGKNSKVKLVITNPTTADWNENGTAGETADAGKYVSKYFNTGKSGTAVKYKAVKSAASTLKYAHVYDPATGKLASVAALPAASAITDGAAPVLLSATRLTNTATEGSLNLTFSEVLSGTPESKDAATNGSSLVLLATNANDNNISDVVGGGTVGHAALTASSSTSGNDTATFYNVDNSLLASLTSVGVTAGNTTFKDANSNLIAAQSKAPAALTADTHTAPAFEKAVAVENSSGFIKTVLLTLTENVTAKGTNKASDFSVVLGGITITPSAVALSGNVLTVTLPGDGIRRDLVTANGTITYTNSSSTTTDYHDSDNNLLANFSGKTVTAPKNSKELNIQEISATLTTDGTASVAKGTLVRADLVEETSGATISFDRGVITVPCGNCSGRTVNIALDNNYGASLSTDISTAIQNRKLTIPVFILVDTLGTSQGNNFSKQAVLKKTQPTAGANQVVYVADLNVRTGAITGQVRGKVTYKTTAPGALKVLDTTYQTVDNGKIRMSVGVTNAEKAALKPGSAFVLVSVKQPKDAEWTLVTSPVPSFKNYLPFKDELSTTGNIAGALGTVDLSKIEKIGVTNTNVWQLLAVNGEINQDVRKKLDVDRFFVTINYANGNPITLWHADTADKDMAFTLKDNKVDTAYEVKQKTVSKITILNGGNGLAFENMASGAGNDFLKVGGAEVDKDSKIFVPVTGNTVKRTMKTGWQLMTSVAAIPAANFSASNIEAVIKVGGGIDSASWFKGAANNTLNATKPDTAYFVYFGKDTKDFKFGK